MNEYTVSVPIETRMRLAIIACRVVYALRHIVGNARAQRWAAAAAYRFARFRVLGGKWQRIQEAP